MKGTVKSRYEEYKVSQNIWGEIILGRVYKKYTDLKDGASWVAKVGIAIGLGF